MSDPMTDDTDEALRDRIAELEEQLDRLRKRVNLRESGLVQFELWATGQTPEDGTGAEPNHRLGLSPEAQKRMLEIVRSVMPEPSAFEATTLLDALHDRKHYRHMMRMMELPYPQSVLDTATEIERRVSELLAGDLKHDRGAYARCSYCGRYTVDRCAITRNDFACDCGRDNWWCGSFRPPGPDARWSLGLPGTREGGNG